MWNKRRWYSILLVGLVLLLASSVIAYVAKESSQSPPPPPKSDLKVHFIDVGQGDSILIDLGDIEILIDGGGKSSGVVEYLSDFVDGALEVMVATHPHADHIGGLIGVLDAFEVDEIWLNGDTSTSQTYSQFMSAVNAESAQVYEARRGDTIEVGELAFDVLHPVNLSGTTNNNSIVLSLSYGEIDFLFTGDAELQAESSMLNLLSDIEILKVGHHGSRSSSSPEFLNLIKPEVAIYMAGEGNSYGHPHQETIAALTEVGAEIYGTDINGTIIITTDGESYLLQPEIPDDSPDEIKPIGADLPVDWQLKIEPALTERGFVISLIDPSGWEWLEGGFFISPEGTPLTLAQVEFLLELPEEQRILAFPTLPMPLSPSAVVSPTSANFIVTNLSVSPSEVKAGESVTISATVTNSGDSSDSYTIILKSNGLAVTFTITKAYAQDNPVEYWAVIVGVADYLFLDPNPSFFPNPFKDYDLDYSDDDATELAAELRSLWGSDHIKLLVDSQATKSAIQNAITDWLDSREDANDVILFYFSGHGGQDGNREYIAPYDTLLTSYTNDIHDDTLNSWLSRLESSKQIIILDSCRSGGFIDELSGPGRIVLTASSENEDTYESSSLEHGVFTYYILDAFNHLDDINDNNDNIISIEEVFDWAESKTISYTATSPQVSHPQIANGLSGQFSLIDDVSVSFSIKPRSSSITIDGKLYLADELPITLNWVEGTTHTITAPDSYNDNGTEYLFDSWNDGVTSLTRIVEASDDASYIANYKKAVNATFNMNPQVYFITIDGMLYLADELPITFNWIEGTTHRFSVPSSLDDNGTEYLFDSWNDGVTSLTRIVEASDDASYIANYKQVGYPIWPYVTGVSVIVVIIATVIARKIFHSSKQ